MTRRVRIRKLNIKRVLLVLFILLIIAFLVFLFIKLPVLGFNVSGNTYYTDNEILEKTGLNNKSSFFLTNSFSINQKVKKDELIDNISIKRNINFRFDVIVKEKNILFYDNVNKCSITDKNKKITYYDEKYPVLVNEIKNEKIYEKLIKKTSKLDKNILYNISEIKHEPNDIDKERFIVSMVDGNYIYLTLSKFTKINDYTKISKTLGDKNGILYLDYGNYFVPFE